MPGPNHPVFNSGGSARQGLFLWNLDEIGQNSNIFGSKIDLAGAAELHFGPQEPLDTEALDKEHKNPDSELSRPWLLENLHPFHRQAYIDALLDQHDYLPDDFRIRIFERPAKVVIACFWPELPWRFEETDDIERICGWNFLDYIPPVMHMSQIGPTVSWVEVDVPALLVWEDSAVREALARPRAKAVCYHAVYALVNANYQGDAEHGDAAHDGDSDSVDDNPQADYACDGVYSSRTYWLKCRFEETETVEEEAMEADENGTAFRRDEFPRYHLDGVEVTGYCWRVVSCSVSIR
ncbi:hypothetical protein B0H13DRAFT_2502891 [Mycena leptocephala]|nr:hypothetical protein B0H13DRAFT_2502891 [Mycena leptocephala]